MLYWIKLIFFQFQFRMGLLQGRNCINLTKKIEPKMNNVEQIAKFTKRIKPKSSCRCCSRKHAGAVFCFCSYINKLEGEGVLALRLEFKMWRLGLLEEKQGLPGRWDGEFTSNIAISVREERETWPRKFAWWGRTTKAAEGFSLKLLLHLILLSSCSAL